METLLTVGLIGSFIAAVTGMHLRLTARPPKGALVPPVSPANDIDAEFFRIVYGEQFSGRA